MNGEFAILIFAALMVAFVWYLFVKYHESNK